MSLNLSLILKGFLFHIIFDQQALSFNRNKVTFLKLTADFVNSVILFG